MRHALLVLMLAACALASCRKHHSSVQDPSSPVRAVTTSAKAADGPATLVILFASTETDPWATELLNTIGAELKIDPWATPGSHEHLDTLGPYDAQLAGRQLKVSIGFAGLSSVVELTAQQALGEEAREWIEDQKPTLVWLDGDQAQFVTGRALSKKREVLFTGVTADMGAYYTDEYSVTGVYRRHSLPRVLDEIWKKAPKASKMALVADSSPISRSRQELYKQVLDFVIGGDKKAVVAEPVDSWKQLHSRLLELQKGCDAVIICGMGEEGSPADILKQPCPAGLLDGVKIPVVTLAPTRADQCGAVAIALRPSAHAHAALELASRILSGSPASTIPPVTPEQMQVYVSDSK